MSGKDMAGMISTADYGELGCPLTTCPETKTAAEMLDETCATAVKAMAYADVATCKTEMAKITTPDPSTMTTPDPCAGQSGEAKTKCETMIQEALQCFGKCIPKGGATQVTSTTTTEKEQDATGLRRRGLNAHSVDKFCNPFKTDAGIKTESEKAFAGVANEASGAAGASVIKAGDVSRPAAKVSCSNKAAAGKVKTSEDFEVTQKVTSKRSAKDLEKSLAAMKTNLAKPEYKAKMDTAFSSDAIKKAVANAAPGVSLTGVVTQSIATTDPKGIDDKNVAADTSVGATGGSTAASGSHTLVGSVATVSASAMAWLLF